MIPKNAKTELLKDGTRWYLLCSWEDREAYLYFEGTQEWYQNGLRHRDDGPAIIQENGVQYWYQKGQFIKEERKGT